MKYLVINNEDIEKYAGSFHKKAIDGACVLIKIGREMAGKTPINTYLVVNTDESYAGEVADLIESHEREKGSWDHGENSLREVMGIPGEYKDTATLHAQMERYKAWVQDLQSGMYVNCVYCGHRYGPADKVPVSMADVLKQHIEQCPEHPMSKLRTQFDRLRAELAKNRWIPVKERLPEEYGSYLCWFIDGFHGVYDWGGQSSIALWEDVTHWMPLPAPPEGVE